MKGVGGSYKLDNIKEGEARGEREDDQEDTVSKKPTPRGGKVTKMESKKGSMDIGSNQYEGYEIGNSPSGSKSR